jgi:hypothetical protein
VANLHLPRALIASQGSQRPRLSGQIARFTAFQNRKTQPASPDRAAHISRLDVCVDQAASRSFGSSAFTGCFPTILRSSATPSSTAALLLHALGVIVDLAGTICSCFLLAAWKAFRDPSVIKAEIARQGRRRPAQIVRRERLQPSSAQMPGADQRQRRRSAASRPGRTGRPKSNAALR